mmetsp:Transcript_23305/g.25841  ORF Transcript_23305/g.25841 Transcript_23305/m.25841 type:complete len:111 (+) Transcript_23305:15-347(+)
MMSPDDDEWTYGVDDVQLIHPNIYHSAFFTASNKDKLQELGITHILSLGNEFDEKFKDQVFTNAKGEQYNLTYKICGLDDDDSENVKQYFEEGIKYIEESLASSGTVLVH